MTGSPTAHTSLTLLFTDIEGSTAMWVDHPDGAGEAMRLHDEIMESAITANGGTVIKTTGDGFLASFPTPRRGLETAIDAQLELARQSDRLLESARVRMALHVGTVEERRGDLFGLAVNRCQRVMAIARAGQILLSRAAAALVQDTLPPQTSLRDLGDQQLRGIPEPERVYQVIHPELRRDFPAPETSIGVRRNLPVELTSFVGREEEVVALRDAASEHQLVTLTGEGGAGKTRLAVEVADRLAPTFPAGAWFIGLESVTDPGLVAERFASTLRVDEQPGRAHLDLVVDHLRDRRALLVVDNCEHVLDACAEVVAGILRSGSPAHVIATSRERLAIAGEATHRVPSLTLPDEHDDAATAARSEAVRLFVDRARLSRPGFAVDDANVGAITRIALQLDGIPLAIELAAAKVSALTPTQIADHLDDRFTLLTGGERTALPRHRTLRAAMDWSYDLLGADERRVLDRLPIFRGGFDLPACEVVCTGGDGADPVISSLTGLVEKSLVIADTDHGRYRLLETVRRYAEENLWASGSADAVAALHARYFTDLAEAAGPELEGPDQGTWLRRLDRDRDNLRAAFEWQLARDDPGAMRLASAIWRFWLLRRRPAEGRDWLDRALGADGDADPAWTLRALLGSGMLASNQGDREAARDLLERAHLLAEETNAPDSAAAALTALALLHHKDGDLPTATATFREALGRARTAGDRVHTSRILTNLALVLDDQGQEDEAARCAAEALDVSHATEVPDLIADALLTSGELTMNHGDDGRARELLEEALRRGGEAGLDYITAWAQAYLGKLRLRADDSRAARAMLGEAVELFEEMESPMGAEWALRHLALAETAEGELAGARESAARALRLATAYVRPDTPLVMFVAAEVLAGAERHEEAAMVMDAAAAMAAEMDLHLPPADLQRVEAVRRGLGSRVAGEPLAGHERAAPPMTHDDAVRDALARLSDDGRPLG